MRRLGVFFMGVSLAFALNIYNKTDIEVIAGCQEVYVGGMPAGFTLKTGSVQVIGICEVVSSKGVGSPAAEVGLRPGDNILKISGILVKSVEDLNKIVADSRGKTLEIEVERGGQVFQYQIVLSLLLFHLNQHI